MFRFFFPLVMLIPIFGFSAADNQEQYGFFTDDELGDEVLINIGNIIEEGNHGLLQLNHNCLGIICHYLSREDLQNFTVTARDIHSYLQPTLAAIILNDPGLLEFSRTVRVELIHNQKLKKRYDEERRILLQLDRGALEQMQLQLRQVKLNLILCFIPVVIAAGETVFWAMPGTPAVLTIVLNHLLSASFLFSNESRYVTYPDSSYARSQLGLLFGPYALTVFAIRAYRSQLAERTEINRLKQEELASIRNSKLAALRAKYRAIILDFSAQPAEEAGL